MELSVSLNVGGERFMTTKETLETYPDTLLGKLVKKNKTEPGKMLELGFDRNPEIVNSVLDFYRTGELHLPSNICTVVAERELRFWRIPVEMISWCCWKKFDSDKNDAAIADDIAQFLEEPLREEAEKEEKKSLRTKIWLTMEFTDYSTLARVWSAVYFAVVLTSVFTFLLQTAPEFREPRPKFAAVFSKLAAGETVPDSNLTGIHTNIFRPDNLFLMSEPLPRLKYVETFSYCFYVLEFLIRLVVCPNKLVFFKDFKNGLDVLLLVHFLLVLVVEKVWLPEAKNLSAGEMVVLMVFLSLSLLRALRVLYFAKDFSTMKVLWLSTKASIKELFLLVICVTTFVTLFAALVFIAEMGSNTNTFPSIPSAMWWAVVTMTTVGYGDVVPVSMGGQLIGAVCALCGIIVIGLPIAVLTSRFTEYHGNMSSRLQMQTTLAFLKDNPQFGKEQMVVVMSDFDNDGDNNDDDEITFEQRIEAHEKNGVAVDADESINDEDNDESEFEKRGQKGKKKEKKESDGTIDENGGVRNGFGGENETHCQQLSQCPSVAWGPVKVCHKD